MTRVASIDIGTVSVRLAIADVVDGQVERLVKRSRICDLGEGLSATGRLSVAAIGRVTDAADDFLAFARESGATACCCTLTSAARDAANSAALLDALDSLGLVAEVIPGEVEGSLTFLGVARDFPGRRIVVADNGGGSTEIAVGSLGTDGTLRVEHVSSADVGCRRVTERFLERHDPPTAADLVEAAAFCRKGLAPHVPWLDGESERPEVLVTVGGTVTTVVAIGAALDPYDSTYVHLHEVTREDLDRVATLLGGLTVGERRFVIGLQEKRAPVILGGVVAVRELMRVTGFDRLTVSESDLLFGLSVVAGAATDGTTSPIGWRPTMVPLDA